MAYQTAGPIPRAKLVRSTLKAAGLGDLVEQVTSGRHTTYVRLVWAKTSDDKAAQVAEALRPLWSDGAERVSVLYKGTVTIRRRVMRWVAE